MFHARLRPFSLPHNSRLFRIATNRFTTYQSPTKPPKWRRTRALIRRLKLIGFLYLAFYFPNPLRSLIYDPLEEYGILDAITRNTIFRITPQPVLKKKPDQPCSQSIYRPLTEPKEIRLILLEPGDKSDQISCKLIHVTLSWRTQYEALSYNWGDSDKRASVVCDGETISVTANLHSALRDLRLTDRQRVLWADCICINQNDLEEKSAQVKMMGQIYASARRTVIWLGEASDDIKGAFSTLEKAYPRVLLHLPISLVFAVVPMLQPFVPRLIAEPHLPKSADWNAVNRLLERPWFQRTWIVQEVILSKYAVVVCGGETINFQKLLTTVRGLRIITTHGGPRHNILELENETVFATTNGLYMINKVRENLRSGYWVLGRTRKWTSTLIDMVHETRVFQCSDPRDRIYAIINVTTEKSPAKRGLPVDYSFDVGEVYRRFVVWDIMENHSLSTLSIISDKTKTDFGLPSWVPDFSNANHKYFLPDYMFTFDATKTSWIGPEARISPDGKILMLKGKRIDVVKRIARTQYPGQLSRLPDGKLNMETVERQREWLRECMDIAIEDYPANEKALSPSFQYWKSLTWGMSNGRFQQFWRTMIWGHTRTGSKAGALYGTYFRAYGGFINANLEDEKVFSTGGIAQELIESCFAVMLSYRKFCSTRNGSIGWVPRGAQVGDVICVLYGGKIPVVLRPRDGGYEFVGDAYVYGMMNGEALVRGGSPDEEFALI
ncbi:heterokaryon incompatibility protein-domain-containing protein [Dendryphion nanum]|uniref:Heterokaryon incompatibility protein-domain-containing protein n=1 Tax=Dendryphion nanum TaxID=256645 RepID=A0A9P9EKW3_9PLEO|nr:heterokaryon incompatibility protein-domain-containing protein [Dendryphion nanum]